MEIKWTRPFPGACKETTIGRDSAWDMVDDEMDDCRIVTVGYIAGVCDLADELKKGAE